MTLKPPHVSIKSISQVSYFHRIYRNTIAQTVTHLISIESHNITRKNCVRSSKKLCQAFQCKIQYQAHKTAFDMTEDILTHGPVTGTKHKCCMIYNVQPCYQASPAAAPHSCCCFDIMSHCWLFPPVYWQITITCLVWFYHFPTTYIMSVSMELLYYMMCHCCVSYLSSLASQIS